MLCKLKTTFAIEFLKKGPILSYTKIISEVFESDFEYIRVNIKLKVLNNGNNSQTIKYTVFNDIKNDLIFMIV